MRVAIAGGAGRMARMLIEAVRDDSQTWLQAVSARPEAQPALRAYLEREGLGHVLVTDAVQSLAAETQAIIDFTAPDYSLALAEAAAAKGCAFVCGTTGFAGEAPALLHRSAPTIPVLYAANFSLGVALLKQLTAQAARALDARFDIEISETHHRHKKDAPSGTALALGEAAATARHQELADAAVYGRSPQDGQRQPGTIGFHAKRGGNVVGEHTVEFFSDGEQVALHHSAISRRIYADGALQAARWLIAQPPGIYGLKDMLAV